MGPLDVLVDGREVEISRPQLRQVLALLVAADGQWLDIAAIEANVWPANAPKSAKASLQVIVNRLRQELGDTDHTIVEHGPSGYRLNRDRCSTDLGRWNASIGSLLDARSTDDASVSRRELRGLWRGEIFAGIGDSDLLARTRRRVDHERVELDRLDAQSVLETNPGLAVRVLEGAHQRDPLREDVAVELFVALAAIDRRVDALAVAAATRKRLREQLGISPSEAFEQAEREVLEHERSGRRGTRPSDADSDGGRDPETAWEPAFVADLAELVRRGTDEVLAILARPGDGGSRVLTALRDQLVNEGQPCLLVGARSADRHVLRSLFQPDDLSAATNAVGEQARAVELLERRYPDGLVLLVDDVDRLDRWSVQLLVRVARSPLVVTVGVLRPDSPVLEELDRSATAIERVVPGPDRERTSSPAPVDERATVEVALAQLDDVQTELVAIGATIGRSFALAPVAAVSGVSEDAVVEHLAGAVTVGLLATELDGYEFVGGAAAAEAVARGAARDRSVIHERLADWFAAQPDMADEAARHYLAALPRGGAERARQAALVGADLLTSRGQHHEASVLYGAAGSLTKDRSLADEIRFKQAKAAQWSGDLEGADEILTELTDRLAAEMSNPDLLASVALAGGGHAGGRIGGQELRRGRLVTALRRLPEDTPRRDVVVVELAYERWAARQPIGREVAENVKRIADSPTSLGHLLARRLIMAMHEAVGPVSIDDARRLADAALAALDGPGDQDSSSVAKCLVVTTSVAQSWGDFVLAEEWIGEVALIGERTGLPQARWQARAMRAALLAVRGRFQEADDEALTGLSIGQMLDVEDAGVTYALHLLGRLYLAGSLSVVVGDTAAAADRMRFPVWFALQGLSLLDQGDEPDAAAALRRAVEFDSGAADYFRPQGLLLALRLAVLLEDRAASRLLAAKLETFSGRFMFLGYGGPFLGPVDWYLGAAKQLEGDDRAAADLLARSADLAVATGAIAWLEAPIRRQAG